MKTIIFSISIILFLSSCNAQHKNYNDEIKDFQYELNTQYADAEKSPLTKEDLKTFKTLDFFKIDEQFKITADFRLTPNAPIFEMPTTTERLPLYRKYGIASFIINGEKFELNLYQNQKYMTSFEYGNLLFLPYNDLTNGKTSYGSGRFIDIKIPTPGSKTIVIDFNKSYNPYCAYNYKYSCPIPPSENNLNIEIKAGVKKYNKHH